MAADAETSSSSVPLPGPRISSIIGLTVVIVTLLGTSILALREPEQITVYVPAEDLPAYTILEQADLRERVFDGPLPGNIELRDGASLVGRITYSSLPQDRAIEKATLGPRVDPSKLQGRVIAGLPVSAERALAGELAAGDLVDIVGVVRGDSGALERVADVQVVRLAPTGVDGRSFALIVAIKPEDSARLARINLAEAVLTRTESIQQS